MDAAQFLALMEYIGARIDEKLHEARGCSDAGDTRYTLDCRFYLRQTFGLPSGRRHLSY